MKECKVFINGRKKGRGLLRCCRWQVKPLEYMQACWRRDSTYGNTTDTNRQYLEAWKVWQSMGE